MCALLTSMQVMGHMLYLGAPYSMRKKASWLMTGTYNWTLVRGVMV